MRGERKEKRTKLLIFFTGVALLCVIVLFVITAAMYSVKFDRTLTDENKAHLAEVANHIAEYTQSIVYDTQALLETAASAAAVMEDESARMDYLRDVAEKQKFAYIGYAGADGEFHTYEKYASGNVSGEPYFQAALEGKSQVTGLTRRIFEDRAVAGILMAVPMRGERQGDDGVLIAMLDISKLQEAMGVESFGGQGYSYIIDKSGELVLRTRSMDYNNFFKVLANVEFRDGYSLSAVRKDVEAGRWGMIQYNNLGTDQYAYYRPLGLNAWTVVNIVSKDVVTGKTASLTRELSALSALAIVVFLVLLTAAVANFVISENRRTATEAKSAFLANMSHEIRTPMNAIVGMSEILLRGGLTEQQQDYVLRIVNSGKSLLTIINDILDLSKIEAGKFIITEDEYEVESMLYDIMAVIAVRIADRPVELFLDVDEKLPKNLTGDMTRVKQILINILGNAAKFTRKGYIKLTIRCASAGESAVRLVMEVEDTGVGIRRQDMDKLFVSFNQVDTHKSYSSEGTGLGLAISKQLSEMMGGTIRVASEYGKGSVFTITIVQKTKDLSPIIDMDWPDDASVLVLEESGLRREFYDACMEHLKIPHKVCGAEQDFLESVEKGGFRYALAGRRVIRSLKRSGAGGSATLVSMLDMNENMMLAAEEAELTIYSPLFCLQLASVLHHHLTGGRGIALKQSGMDLSAVRPLPYALVLIVDDNEVNLQVATGLMHPYGMRIDCVLSGAAAVDAVQEKEYDLVLMDHMMPEMDGAEALHKIRELPDPKYRKLPIVALTANATRDAQKLFLDEGFDGFLAKPIETAKLDEILKKWLSAVNDKRAMEDPDRAKTVPTAKKSALSDEETKFLQMFNASREMDFKGGAERMHGLKSYARVLRTYCSSTEKKLSEMDGFRDSDQERFTIEAHGLKGACAAIGAGGVSELAKKLEFAGKEHNRRAVDEIYPVFLERIRNSLAETGRFLSAYEEEFGGEKGSSLKRKPAGEALSQKDLDELEKAFYRFDTEKLADILERCGRRDLSERERKLLKELYGYYQAYEFEEPIRLISAYRNKNGREEPQ